MSRRGTTLAELIVVLLLGSMVVALYASTVVAQRRAERTAAGANAPAAAADESVHVLMSAFERIAAGDSVWIRGDTAFEWRATIGVAIACAYGGDTVVVPDSGAAAWWESAPDSGDAAELGGTGTWTREEVLSVSTQSGGGACGGAQRTLRLRSALALGAVPVVRVTRRTRFMLYQGGDGAWWLGQRTCSFAPPLRCTSAQPVAGPLAAPPLGLRFALDSASVAPAIALTVTAGRVVRAARVTVHP
jgi:hypothetical protein